MSDNAYDESRFGTLHVQAGAGVEMRILRSDLSEVARGSGMIIVNVPDGIYAVEWLSAGKRSESIVRVKATEPTFVTYPENCDFASDIGRKFSQANEVVSHVEALRRPSERDYGAWITVVLSVPQDISAAQAMAPTRLLDRVGNPMRANDHGQADLELSGCEAARVYHVEPGTYRLAFLSVMGETIEQTIPAMRNRGTIVFMQGARSEILKANGDAYARETRDGIDLAKTIIVSVNGSEDDRRIRERIRLAGVLLHDIAYGVGSLSDEFIMILDDPATDPLLRLYASLAVLNGLDQDRSPAIQGLQPADGHGTVHANTSDFWASCAARWISSLGGVGAPPDTVAARWRLSTIAPESVGQWGYGSVAKRIRSPPMLERSWLWAITRSVGVRNAIPISPALLGAIRSPVGAGPWLCWKSAAAKAAPKKLHRPLPVEWSQILASISQKATDLRDRSPHSDYYDLFQLLSPEVGDTALKVTNLKTESIAGSAISSAQEDLAISLGLPGRALMRRLVRTEAEITKALDQLSTGSDPLPEKGIRTESGIRLDEAPALSRRIQWADDPHKGRFGGHPENMGFGASAIFTPTRSRDWTHVHITVEGEVPEGTPAHFYLHDSFIPDKRVVSFRRSRAQLVLTAWGAFTVGVWMPKQGVELELDLALVEEAPSPFKER